MYSRSTGSRRGCSSGLRYSHRNSGIPNSPSSPVTMGRQLPVSGGRRTRERRQRGADRRNRCRRARPPSRSPAWETTRHRLGAPGQLADSPRLSRNLPASCADRSERRRHRGERIERDGGGQPGARADAIQPSPARRLPDRVGDAECDDEQREVRVRPAKLGLENRRHDVQRLAVDVIDDRGEEQDAADVPAQPANRPGHQRRSSSAAPRIASRTSR